MTKIGNKAQLEETFNAYAFLTPALLILGIFTILPIFYAIFLAFHRLQILGDFQVRFVGGQNFSRILGDERVFIALKNTFEYVIFVVPCQTILALILAIILNSQIKGKNIFRVLFFLPTVTSSTVLTLIFIWIYNRQGLLNGILSFFGLPVYNWLGDPKMALKSIMLMNIWSTAPFFMVIFLAALQDIPEYLYEAAQLDGANKFEQFWHITLPFLKPVTFFVVVMGIIGTFQLFDQSYIFSGGSGAPNNATLTVVLLIYQYAFKSLDLGYAGALALMLAGVILLVTLIQRFLFKDEVN